MIDFHCHLDLYPDPRAITQECVRRGLYVLSVTTTPSAWTGTSALAQQAPRIRTALGLHPQVAHERKGELPLFERLIKEVRYVGEIGLDGGTEYRRHWDVQLSVFTRVLEVCTGEGGRILTIHSRRAAAQVLTQLEKYPAAGTPILHWFSGTQAELKRAIAIGCWFSVGPTMLSSDKGRALAAKMPKERVLLESDGPFARLDGRPALPWDTEGSIDTLATVWEEAAQSVRQRLLVNLRTLGAQHG